MEKMEEDSLLNRELKNVQKLLTTVTEEMVLLKNEILFLKNELKNGVTEELSSLKNQMKNFNKKEDQVNGHIEVIKKLTHERLTSNTSASTLAWVPPVDVTKVETVGKKKNLILTKYDDDYTKVYGKKTYEYRHFIRQVEGAKWLDEDKCWLIPTTNSTKLEEMFNDNKVEFEKE